MNVFSQEINIKHTVSKGETIYKIAKQYQVTINDIFELNPSSKKGIQIKTVLLIPNKNSKNINTSTAIVSKSNVITHKVLPNETLFGLAKQYHIALNDLYQCNPTLKTTGLKINQELNIPLKEDLKSSEKEVVAENIKSNKDKFVKTQNPIEPKNIENSSIREVQPKETKYGIAKEFGITVDELENQNPEVKNNLPVGYKLNIRSSKIVLPKVQEELVLKVETTNKNEVLEENADLADQLIVSASENLGTRYRSGGTTKEGFDCSGLIYTTFGEYDIQLPRSSFEQSKYGVKIKNADAQRGDLIFFKTSKRKQINHVGMVVEVCDGDIKFIHSSVKGGVMISSVKESYYANTVTQINRVL